MPFSLGCFHPLAFVFKKGKNFALSQPLEVLEERSEFYKANAFSIDSKDMPFCHYKKTTKGKKSIRFSSACEIDLFHKTPRN